MSGQFDFSDLTTGLPRPESPGAPPATGPPVGWLFAAAATAVVAGATAFFIGENAGVAFASWALAGPVVIGLVTCYERHAARRRAWTSPEWTRPLYRTVLALMVVATAVAAWRIAEWAGRL